VKLAPAAEGRRLDAVISELSLAAAPDRSVNVIMSELLSCNWRRVDFGALTDSAATNKAG